MQVVGARGSPEDPEARLRALRGFPDVQILDARRVVGRDHLLTALEHAERAMREHRNAAKSLAVEFMLYAAGERQIGDALTKMGIRGDTTTFAVVRFGGEDLASVLEALRLTRDDSALEPSREKLAAFGVSEPEIASVPPDRVSDLVLERVALVDLTK